MEKTIFNKIREFNKNATDVSISLYTRNVMSVAKLLGVKPEDVKPSIFKNIKDVMKALEHQSIYTQQNKIVAVYLYLQSCGYDKDVIIEYNDKIFMLAGKGRAKSSSMQWNEKEKEKVVSMDEIMIMLSRMRDELPKDLDTFKSIEKMMKYLCIKIYSGYPMRNDMADMQIYSDTEFKNIKEDKDINYMVINPKNMECKIILNNFKTKKEGEIDFAIDDKDLIKMIYDYYLACKKYYENNERDYNHYFLFKRDYLKMSRNVLTKFLLAIFEHEIGKKISTTMLRKITTSSLIDTAKFKKLAYIQGHSVGTALNTYSKF